MTPSGQRDRKVTFYPVTATEDGMGTETDSRGTGIPAWAKVFFGSGQERRDAGAEGAVQTATFNVLSNTALRALNERAQIQFDGDYWGVVSIAALGPQGAELEFTARRGDKG